MAKAHNRFVPATSREEDPWIDGYFDATEGNPKKSKDLKYLEGYKSGADGMAGKIEVEKHEHFNADYETFF